MIDYCEKQLTLSLMSDIWQYIIVNTNKTPARTVIKIFSDISYNFRKIHSSIDQTYRLEKQLHQTTLNTIAKKTNCSNSTVNRSIARLEKMGYIKRHLKHVKTLNNQWLFNVLFIELTENGYKLCDLIPNFYQNNQRTSSPQIHIDILKDNNKNIDLDKLNINNIKKETFTKDFINNQQKSDIVRQLEKSTTVNVSFNSVKIPNTTTHIKNIKLLKEACSLANCLPVTEEEAIYLRRVTGKDYSTIFINDLVMNLSIKNTTFTCWSRKGFIEYIHKAILNEKRTVEDVKAGKYQFKHKKEQSELFTVIENSTEVTIAVLLKKRIINCLTPDKALQILKNYRFSKEAKINKYNNKKSYIIYYLDEFEPIAEEKNLLTKIVQEYSSYIDQTTGSILFTAVIFIKNTYQKSINELGLDLLQDKTANIITSKNDAAIVESNNHPVWFNVRKRLLEKYGINVDKSWFSKIGFEYDQISKIVKLQYPSVFMQRKADTDYGYWMYKFIQAELPDLTIINSKANDSKITENVWWINYNCHDSINYP